MPTLSKYYFTQFYHSQRCISQHRFCKMLDLDVYLSLACVSDKATRTLFCQLESSSFFCSACSFNKSSSAVTPQRHPSQTDVSRTPHSSIPAPAPVTPQLSTPANKTPSARITLQQLTSEVRVGCNISNIILIVRIIPARPAHGLQ